ncbi:hypothetical protein [Roseibium sp.]|uniref:hypothetical protein n=1 Tax=Roseibium sp. TaxID=1936156 RepID=UPI003BA9AA9C
MSIEVSFKAVSLTGIAGLRFADDVTFRIFDIEYWIQFDLSIPQAVFSSGQQFGDVIRETPGIAGAGKVSLCDDVHSRGGCPRNAEDLQQGVIDALERLYRIDAGPHDPLPARSHTGL